MATSYQIINTGALEIKCPDTYILLFFLAISYYSQNYVRRYRMRSTTISLAHNCSPSTQRLQLSVAGSAVTQ